MCSTNAPSSQLPLHELPDQTQVKTEERLIVNDHCGNEETSVNEFRAFGRKTEMEQLRECLQSYQDGKQPGKDVPGPGIEAAEADLTSDKAKGGVFGAPLLRRKVCRRLVEETSEGRSRDAHDGGGHKSVNAGCRDNDAHSWCKSKFNDGATIFHHPSKREEGSGTKAPAAGVSAFATFAAAPNEPNYHNSPRLQSLARAIGREERQQQPQPGQQRRDESCHERHHLGEDRTQKRRQQHSPATTPPGRVMNLSESATVHGLGALSSSTAAPTLPRSSTKLISAATFFLHGVIVGIALVGGAFFLLKRYFLLGAAGLGRSFQSPPPT